VAATTKSSIHALLYRDKDCPKNHIEHITTTQKDGATTDKGFFHLLHHKEQKHGPIRSPLAPAMVKVVTMLEKASHHLASRCPTIFPNQQGKPCSTTVFQHVSMGWWVVVAVDGGWRVNGKNSHTISIPSPSLQRVTTALSILKDSHVTATDIRHEVSTKWRNWVSTEEAMKELLGLNLEKAVAHMMGNSPASWDAAYDDFKLGRDQQKVRCWAKQHSCG
jgi:hypothetical protein